jgi:hypothetical protein
MATTRDYDEFDPNELYDQFPRGEEQGHGTGAGYNTYIQINSREWFREEALREHPALEAFVRTGDEISISFAQFKSSTRESEYAIHKPHLTMASEEDRAAAGLATDLDIRGDVRRYPGPAEARIGTFVINHQETLARWKQSVIVMEDGAQAGQMIYKHPEPPREEADASGSPMRAADEDDGPLEPSGA